jgi:putative MATE family efflux protein
MIMIRSTFVELTRTERKALMLNFLKYSLPAIAGSLVSTLYMVIDGIVLGRGVGASALAAVTLAFPAVIIVTSIAMGLSFGGANLISIHRGEGNLEKANEIFAQSMTLMVVLPLLIGVAGRLFLTDIARLLGSSDLLLPDVSAFLEVYLLGCVLFAINFGLNAIIRNDSNPVLAMLSTIISTLANIGLAVLFIFQFHWGIRGAALANLLGSLIGILILMIHFIRRQGVLRLAGPVFNWNNIMRILKIGFPSILIELSYAVSAIAYNLTVMQILGEIGASAYSIVNYLMNLIFMIIMGFSQGGQPLFSYYHGAGDKMRVSYAYRICIRSAVFFSALMLLLYMVASRPLVMLFNTSNNELISLAVLAMSIYTLGSVPMAVNFINTTFYQSIEKVWLSNLICVLRGFAYVILFLLVLPRFWGSMGIWLVPLFTESLTLLTTIAVSLGSRWIRSGHLSAKP